MTQIFTPTKVLTQEHIASIIHLYLGNSASAKCISVGSIIPTSLPEIVVHIMDAWVHKMDQFIALAHVNHSKAHSMEETLHQLSYERGFTYGEYLRLFDTLIPETDFFEYPIFRFLGIQSNALRHQFTQHITADILGYIKVLEQASIAVWKYISTPYPVQVSYSHLAKHMYINGKSGAGKSELIKRIIYQIQGDSLEKRDVGMVVLDPHGDLAEEVCRFNLNIAADRLIYIAPFLSINHSPVLNPLDIGITKGAVDLDKINIISEELVRAFQELFADATLSNQMRAILLPCLSTLLLKGDASLVDIQTFMDDERNADLIALGCKNPNPSHRRFFQTQFKNSLFKTTKMAIFTRLQGLLNSQAFYRLVVGKSTFYLDQALDAGKVIIFNLSKGQMGSESSEVFGKFIVASLQAFAQRRARFQQRTRKPIFAFIDEFQNFTTPSIQIILKEARKFGVHLILAHQTTEDIQSTDMLSNVMNNTDVKAVFRNGHETIRRMGKEISLPIEKLQDIPQYHFYLKSGDEASVLVKTSIDLQASQYQLTQEELVQVLQQQIQRYYRPIIVPNFDIPDGNSASDLPKAKFDV